MQTPESRREFEHNINLIVDEAHRIDDAPQDTLESFLIFTYPQLKKMRFLPNGRINLNTVDEELRLQANSKNQFSKMEPFYDDVED